MASGLCSSTEKPFLNLGVSLGAGDGVSLRMMRRVGMEMSAWA